MKKTHCPINRINPANDWNYFFGYYDKSPWNKDETKVLAHRSKLLTNFPDSGETVEMGYIKLADGQFVKMGETQSWNWQQGTQLQWLNQNENGEEIIFNDFNGNKERSKIVNPASGKEKIVDSSIYTIAANGKVALTLNYGRLYQNRKDYGYACAIDSWSDIDKPEQDGIYSVDIEKNTKKLILSIKEIAEYKENNLGLYTKHWVNHMMFNPSGTRFCFLHRFQRPDGIIYSRFFTANSNGKNLRLIFEGMISHYSWKNDSTILAWAGKRKLLGQGESGKKDLLRPLKKIIKPIYYALGKPRFLMQKIMGDSYYLIQDVESENNAERIAFGKLISDGHCTISSDKKWILTDGYTDRNNKLPLYLYNMETEALFEIGRYKTPKELDGEVRVDLHPRFNSSGDKVIIDSAMNGKRDMFLVDIKNIVN
ncbi:hypothetical protein [Maribellus mangrovi]|uniref:hypothetical protein n=1 Tax=Maribellus mangrovi TaxID=3133146 RepID=UPI0030EDBD0A